MTTPVQFTGFNHGVVSANGGGLFNAVTGTPTIVTANDPFGISASLLECAPSAAQVRGRWTANAQNVSVFSFYVKFPSALPAADARISYAAGTDATECYFKYQNSTQKFGIQWGAGSTTVGGSALATDTWYKIDIRITWNVDPHTCEWSINEVAQTTVNNAAGAATTANHVNLGTNANDTYTARYAYPVLSTTSADYPIPARTVTKVLPTDDGTHSPSTPDCIRGGGASPALISGSNKAFQYMDDATFPSGASPTTDRINQDITSGHTTHYVEMIVSGFSAKGGVCAVIGLLAYGGDSTTANNGTTRVVVSDATATDIFSGDMSETSVFYKFAKITPPASGWNVTEVNACKFRLGFSTDITPNPYWQALMLEVMVFVGVANRNYGFVIG